MNYEHEHRDRIIKSLVLFFTLHSPILVNICHFNLQAYKMKSRHPFMDIDIEISKSTMDAVDSIRTWLTFQPHLPKLNGEF